MIHKQLLSLVALTQLFTFVNAETLYPGKYGQELIEQLKEEYTPGDVSDYRTSRERMFNVIDNDGGLITLAYTGSLYYHNPQDISDIPDHTIVNCEHTWPQSKFDSKEPMKSDLHHLFGVWSRVNSSRSNDPFAEIIDSQTTVWWGGEYSSSSMPTIDKDRYSESDGDHFEPREAHKGNVARAMFYIYTIYNDRDISKEWFEDQASTLQQWNQLDPVDSNETARNEAIAYYQNNLNPFILDPTLVDRVLNESSSDTPDTDEPSDTVTVVLKASNTLGVPVHPYSGDNSVIYRFPDEAVATVLEVDPSNNWLHIEYNSQRGWITSSYVQ